MLISSTLTTRHISQRQGLIRRRRRTNPTFCESMRVALRQPWRSCDTMKYSLSRFSVDPAQVPAARQALEKLVAAIHKNDPEVVYLVFQEPGHPVFFTLVSFQDEENYRRHATSRHVAEFARTILPLCDGKPSFVGLDLVTAARSAKSRAAKRPAAPKPARKAPVRLAASRRRRA